MIAVTFTFSGSGTQEFILDKPRRFVGFCGSGTFVISTNPAIVTADWTAPGTTAIRRDILGAKSANTSTAPDVAVQLNKGAQIYVAAGAASSCCVYLD